jgi:hypothetical protein
MNQTPEEHFLSTFRPEEVAALQNAAQETCLVCWKQFPADPDDPLRRVCPACLRDGYDSVSWRGQTAEFNGVRAGVDFPATMRGGY